MHICNFPNGYTSKCIVRTWRLEMSDLQTVSRLVRATNTLIQMTIRPHQFKPSIIQLLINKHYVGNGRQMCHPWMVGWFVGWCARLRPGREGEAGCLWWFGRFTRLSWFRRRGRARRHRRYLWGRSRRRPWRRLWVLLTWRWWPSSGLCSCRWFRSWRDLTASSYAFWLCRMDRTRYRPRWLRTGIEK